MSEEKATVILGLRVSPSWKAAVKEEAESRGQTLTAFIWDLLESGFNAIYGGGVKQKEDGQ